MNALWRWLFTFGVAVSVVFAVVPPWLAAQQTPSAVPKTAPEGPAPKEPAPKEPAAEEPAPKAAPKEPIERRPYRISFHLGCDPAARFDEPRRTELLREWQVLVRRFVGTPWVLSIAGSSSPLCTRDPATVDNAAFAGFTDFDKVWLARIVAGDDNSSFELVGREYDTATRRLGPIHRRAVPAPTDAPRALLKFSRDLFNPTGEVVGQEGGKALLTVQGAALEPASPIGAVVTKGMIFQPLRLVSLRDGKVQILRIPFTYLEVDSVEGPVARCSITTGLHDPFTKRMARASSFGALGLKPGDSPLTLRFVTKADKAPAAGYTLTSRRAPDGQPRELGTTDRAGRIVLKPRFADGLVILRLLAGAIEPMVELPMMPGESSDERVIPFDPKPQTVALETQIESLRDEVVDLVALRARLESRMKARFEGEDWTGLEETLNEFGRLTPRDQFAQRLAKLKEDAAQEQSNLKTAILTKTASAQITDVQSMIDRYLDDELYNLFRQELEKIKKEAQAPATKKSAVAARVAPARTPKVPLPDQAAASKAASASARNAAAPAPAAPAQPAQAQPQRRPNPPKAKSDVPF
jgi:hypothetical protein